MYVVANTLYMANTLYRYARALTQSMKMLGRPTRSTW